VINEPLFTGQNQHKKRPVPRPGLQVVDTQQEDATRRRKNGRRRPARAMNF
jgi:hypothetical protein